MSSRLKEALGSLGRSPIYDVGAIVPRAPYDFPKGHLGQVGQNWSEGGFPSPANQRRRQH